jgi:hypothetical protein
MAPQERAVAITPIGFKLLASSQAWLGESGHGFPDLSEGGASLVGSHWRPGGLGFDRQLLLQAGDELSALLAGKLVRQIKYLVNSWCCHNHSSFVPGSVAVPLYWLDGWLSIVLRSSARGLEPNWNPTTVDEVDEVAYDPLSLFIDYATQ